jgi:hypothetical protein
MRQLESGAINEALPVLAVALALGFRGAMYGIATHLHRRLPPSPFGSYLLLAGSSRLMRGSVLVRVALESRSFYALLIIRGRLLGKMSRLSSGL